MSADVTPATVLLVGPGRAGRAFGRSWMRSGRALTITGRDPAAVERAAGVLPGARVVSWTEPRLSADALLVAVSDDAIAPVASEVSRRVSCRFGFHLSGALPAGELAPLAASGVHVGSLHPLRAFTGAADEDWKDAFVAVEGESDAAESGAAIARAVGAQPHRIDASDKPAYHAAATLAAGGVASIVSVAARLWSEIGIDEAEARSALAQLSGGAIDAVARLPFADALTGPIARRDARTVQIHAKSLAGRPRAALLYALLAAETLDRTAGRGDDPTVTRALRTLREEASRAAVDRSHLPPKD